MCGQTAEKEACFVVHQAKLEVIMVKEEKKTSPGITEHEGNQLQLLGRGQRTKKKSSQLTSPYTLIGARKRSHIIEDRINIGNQYLLQFSTFTKGVHSLIQGFRRIHQPPNAATGREKGFCFVWFVLKHWPCRGFLII